MWTFTKHSERIQKFRKASNLKHWYGNELDKASFAHDVAYSDSKDIAKIIILDRILKDKTDEIAKNCNFDGCQRALARKVYKFFDKKTGPRVSVNEQLAEELHKSVTKKFKRNKVHVRFKDNYWAADFA